ncbi:MAG: SpoIIE family protein phosphatase [Lawsonibacter sp.]
MTARENLKTKLSRLRRQTQKTGQVRLPASTVTMWAEAGIYFLLAGALAGGVLLEDCAPFGVALVGTAGSGLYGGTALLGACFGYLSFLGFSQGLRRASAAILVFAVAFAFYDVKFFRRPWVMPVVSGAISAMTGAIVLAQGGWTTKDLACLTLETVLTVVAVWCYRAVLRPIGGQKESSFAVPGRRAGLLFLLATVLTSLVPLQLYEDISLGRSLGILAVLCAAWQGGPAIGAVVGSALGTAMDLAAGEIPLYAVACALSGLTAGLCQGKRRVLSALVYIMTNGAVMLWMWNLDETPVILYEAFWASMLFLLLPPQWLRRLGAWMEVQSTATVDGYLQQGVQQRLEATAQAFRTLGESLRAAFQTPSNDNDVSGIFDRAANRVCRGCPLRGRCWKQEYTSTFNALNDATAAMVERGRAEAADFPGYFSSRCLHFPAFLTAVNVELTALCYRRQYNARVRENRAAVCRQYLQLSELLGAAAAELSQELAPDLVGDRRVRQRMAELGLDVRTAVYRDGRGLLRVEVEGADWKELARPSRLGDLALTLGVPLRVEREEKDRLALIQQEPLMAVAGVAARKKGGETVSGDAGTYFKNSDGKLYVLLCDGMGSGPEANRESSLAVRLTEQFLQAGVEARQALTTLSSALALKGEETGGFTTVDLLEVDLFTGEGMLYKMGAAPTYVRKGRSVQRLSGNSLPAGLGENSATAMDQFPLRLNPGDTVLMASDGVCAAGEDDWLRKKLENFDGTSPKDLARDLVTQSPKEATDDRTALVIRIEKRS